MKFIKKIDDIYVRDRIPVIYMAEAITNIRSPWRTRALDWFRQRVPGWRRRSAIRKRRSYTFSPSRRSRVQPPVLSIRNVQSNLWTGLSHRYGSLLGRARSFTDASADLFQARLLTGMERLVRDPFQMMNRGLSLDNALLFYQYGELCEPQYGFHPLTHKTTERFLRDKTNLDYLIQGQNLKHFIYTLDTLFSQARKQHETKLEQLKEDQQLIATVNFLDLLMRATFMKQEVIALEIKAADTLRDKKAHDKLREEKAEANRQVLEQMVDYGYTIEQTRNAINSRSEIMIATIVMRKKGLPVAKKVLKESPHESLPTLIEAAVDLTTKQKGADVVNRSVLLAAHVLRNNPEMLPTMITELNSAYHNSFIKGAQTEADLARVKILSQILENSPAALPHVLQAHDKHYSWFKTVFAPVFQRFGVKIRDISSKVFSPIAAEIAKNREGENTILTHAYNITATNPERVFYQFKRFKLAKGSLGRSIALQLAKSALNHNSTMVPVFARKSLTEALRATIYFLANSNICQRSAETLSVKDARALIFIAAKIHQLRELLRENRITEAVIALQDLDNIDGTPEFASIRVPFMDETNNYISARDRVNYGEKHYRNAGDLTEFIITRETGEDVFGAGKVVNVLKSGALPIWNFIPSPVNEAALRGDPNYSLPLVTFYTRYAYCFLTATWMQTKNPEHRIRDLNSTLSADTDHKQLFLTLQSIPPVIKKTQLTNFARLLEEAGHPELAARILKEYA